MKVLSKIKMLFAATAIASVMMPTAAIADNGEKQKQTRNQK